MKRRSLASSCLLGLILLVVWATHRHADDVSDLPPRATWLPTAVAPPPPADQAASLAPAAGELVVGVVDGDTLDLAELGRIRLHGIDAPERAQPWGPEATDALRGLVAGARLQATVLDTDRYGRVVAELWLEGTSVNRWLVANGHAWVARRYTQDPDWIADEASARAAGRGLWALPDPQPPWAYRQAQRSSSATASEATPASTTPPGEGTGFWLNTRSGVRHNQGCASYRMTAAGRDCGPTDGRPCGVCGG